MHCPICGEGPFKKPEVHAYRKHGVTGLFVEKCAIDGCDKNEYKKCGLCVMHERRRQRNGDPTAVRRVRAYAEGDAKTYHAVHSTLKRERGPAKDHYCECGAAAVHWAYDHQDPDEWLEVQIGQSMYRKVQPVRVVRYSVKLEHYKPMCRACHTRLDVLTWSERVSAKRRT